MDDQIKQDVKQSDASTANSSSDVKYSTKDLNVNFLGQIYEIMRCLEKETQENSMAKTIGSTNKTQQLQQLSTSEYLNKIQQLRETFEQFRQQITYVPGSCVSKDEQLQILGSLRQQLIMKKDLLLKYKNSKLMDHLQFQPQPQSTQSSHSIINSIKQ